MGKVIYVQMPIAMQTVQALTAAGYVVVLTSRKQGEEKDEN
jgi:hypothetical protein